VGAGLGCGVGDNVAAGDGAGEPTELVTGRVLLLGFSLKVEQNFLTSPCIVVTLTMHRNSSGCDSASGMERALRLRHTCWPKVLKQQHI
jgi:hypothetical protein